MLKNFLVFILLFPFLSISAQKNPLQVSDSISQQQWVNSKYDAMSIDEKIGQLFMVSVASNQSKASTNKINQLIAEEHIGGVIFSVGGPVQQAKLTNKYQKTSKLPLLIGMDAEWGLSMRLDSTYAFPWNMTLGAIRDSSIVEKVGRQIGKHAKRLGVHINFAPDIDINTNPQNPIIGNRSFGEDRENVTRNGIAFMKGMESVGVLSNGKHFPGHGDTATDSHKTLPQIPFDRARLDSIEMYPFKKIIKEGISSIMVAHLNVPSLEMQNEIPSSLSEQIISGILKDELGFKGLVFTDALNMNGVGTSKIAGDVELDAFMAGNDILLMPKDVKTAKARLLNAYSEGKITEQRLETSVKKILMSKYKVGLQHYKPTEVKNLFEDLNNLENDLIYEEAIENAITVAKNEFLLLPLKKIENKKIAYIHFGDAEGDSFYNQLKKYTDVARFDISDLASVSSTLASYNVIIVGHHKSNESPWKSYKYTQEELGVLKQIASLRTSNLILAEFVKPYSLLDIKSLQGINSIIIGYQNSKIAQERVAQAIFGAIPVNGLLPVTVHPELPVNTSLKLGSLLRLGYSFPEREGMNSTKLAEVDELVQHGLDSLMFPGAQVLVARHGKVIYNKAFGKPVYDTQEKLTIEHIFDLASLTKILSSLPILMKMEEEGKLKLNQTFKDLVPEYSTSDLKDVTVLKALSHYGRIPAWIAFYVSTLDKSRKPSHEFYRTTPTEGFSIKVNDKLFLTNAYKDSIYNRIGRQELKSNRYRYSDVGYYVFHKYIEDTYGEPQDKLANDFFYAPLGATTTTYNPLNKFDKDRIVPTEEDNYYRYERVQGYVHDMGAAMQGGVGGHAGLFSNANDVAKIMQMYLQGGTYGGKQYLTSRTIKKFNTCYFCNENVRRGVGFDKPDLRTGSPTCGCVSHQSFGHSGFTGTYTWADPDKDLVYVFLSNRTYPTASNTLLVKSSLRTRIQKAIYDAIEN
ncbi:serine hydrolase [Cellulophaga baltica]|uniref:glycoside hydrolase family 3 N-terminal domain-containing protein n=1 Tax=Cellulophaga TaxID=104264 RepID=UPI001C07648D|nr:MULTISPECIES: glycoside hydrolase family 3 N-terminal domain-containing protein [Cellulophaga]MBU2996724.1 serine hydrolase [Cellulophaga baltica]MDO6768118.1 glycoside hydrolase family 3 N-terminal domain-containing protein [Cellulophaga sp. 1_MG-2023]